MSVPSIDKRGRAEQVLGHGAQAAIGIRRGDLSCDESRQGWHRPKVAGGNDDDAAVDCATAENGHQHVSGAPALLAGAEERQSLVNELSILGTDTFSFFG